MTYFSSLYSAPIAAMPAYGPIPGDCLDSKAIACKRKIWYAEILRAEKTVVNGQT